MTVRKIVICCLMALFNPVWGQSIVAPLSMDYREVVLINRAAKNFIKDSSITIIIKPESPLHPLIEGVTYQINPKLYTIDLNFMVKNRRERMWVLLHELGHIIDINNGMLNQHPPRWMGRRMNNSLPWELRPWEMSADEWALEMWAALVNEPPPYIIFKMEKSE